MELFTQLIQGFSSLFGISPILAITVGVIFGIWVGAMPGLSPSMGVALMLPFTFRMPANISLMMLTAVYLAANYGGSITAVTINTPGTPAAIPTAFDGYPLTQQGKIGWGLGISLWASVIGGFIGILVLILFSKPLADIAVKMHPAEYFSLALLGLSSVASLGGKSGIKSFAMAMLGLLISTIGLDPISGVKRFTFGQLHLFDGFDLIPLLIGLFALSEVFERLETKLPNTSSAYNKQKNDGQWPKIGDYWKLRRVILQSSFIGTVIGIFPGAGSAIASLISYDFAKRTSKSAETFGSGNPEGLAASEAANSASVGGAMVPMLTLGIPGSASAAVLLSALAIHDLVPGPMLFKQQPVLVYGLFASMLVANLIMLAIGLLGTKIWVKVTLVPQELLIPLIVSIALVGSFAVKNSLFDVFSCIGFGVVGWLLKRYGFPTAPIVLGLVLGSLAESNFRKAVIMGGYSVFFTRPASLVLIIISILFFVLPFIQFHKDKKRH
ncbi:MAG TPA: tripartite tricarboxylate transporter permease [Bacillota bacterium]|nr:tripartite tricarboxylate transporter permease [Bacillota bacterium]HQJ23177.1 tripartite tricarboxylate transporter permease [Rectinema sp.]